MIINHDLKAMVFYIILILVCVATLAFAIINKSCYNNIKFGIYWKIFFSTCFVIFTIYSSIEFIKHYKSYKKPKAFSDYFAENINKPSLTQRIILDSIKPLSEKERVEIDKLKQSMSIIEQYPADESLNCFRIGSIHKKLYGINDSLTKKPIKE